MLVSNKKSNRSLHRAQAAHIAHVREPHEAPGQADGVRVHQGDGLAKGEAPDGVGYVFAQARQREQRRPVTGHLAPMMVEDATRRLAEGRHPPREPQRTQQVGHALLRRLGQRPNRREAL